jgi:8-amino-7-oxononanoate synthase
MKSAFQTGIDRYALGSGGSMVVSGYHASHHDLERGFSEALGVDDCLIFSSGYAANLSVIGLLAHFNAHVLIDKMVHASIYDGLKSVNCKYQRYLHNNLVDLRLKLQSVSKNIVLVTEGIFSMSGELAPLGAIAELAKNQIEGLIVDEAHAFGVLGKEGLGAVFHHDLTQETVPLRIIPLGKAFASTGAIVAGQGAWIDALLQSARPYIYSTGISPAMAYGVLKTLDLLREADDRRAHVQQLIQYFRSKITRSSMTWRDSITAIQQLQLGCPKKALEVSQYLQNQGVFCLPMRQPTVSKQDTGLRVILNYNHQPEDIDYLFQLLNEAIL